MTEYKIKGFTFCLFLIIYTYWFATIKASSKTHLKFSFNNLSDYFSIYSMTD